MDTSEKLARVSKELLRTTREFKKLQKVLNEIVVMGIGFEVSEFHAARFFAICMTSGTDRAIMCLIDSFRTFDIHDVDPEDQANFMLSDIVESIANGEGKENG
jgi:hypothetical protein